MKRVITIIAVLIGLSASAQDSTAAKSSKRPIDRIKIWSNGQTFDADDIDVVCVWDDLKSTARFFYTLSDSTGKSVTSGNVELTGAKYVDYANKANHDDRAVVLVMRELNVKQRAARTATQAAKAASAATVVTQKP